MPEETPPNPLTPQPLVLDYDRAQKAKRFATRGLLLMGLAFTALGSLMLVQVLPFMVRASGTSFLPRFWILREFLSSAIPLLWGIAYVLCALFIRLGRRTAAWIALIMTSIHVAAWIVFLYNIFFNVILDNPWDDLGRKILVIVLFLAITAGFVVLPLEVWKALRNPEVWRR